MFYVITAATSNFLLHGVAYENVALTGRTIRGFTLVDTVVQACSRLQ